jgi:hypothetical protein
LGSGRETPAIFAKPSGLAANLMRLRDMPEAVAQPKGLRSSPARAATAAITR